LTTRVWSDDVNRFHEGEVRYSRNNKGCKGE
jgi:hypothetical protein